mmetsp:Transcript_11031/g.18296  ORF Transcript_11031/g.18296 Transcript_11031/m.18296 type:complete len:154 (-) Transcript_11031:150-611(-)
MAKGFTYVKLHHDLFFTFKASKAYKKGPADKKEDFDFWVNGIPKKYTRQGIGKDYNKKSDKSGFTQFYDFCAQQDAPDNRVLLLLRFYQRVREMERMLTDRDKYMTLFGLIYGHENRDEYILKKEKPPLDAVLPSDLIETLNTILGDYEAEDY